MSIHLVVVTIAVSLTSFAHAELASSDITQVVMLGTGTPNPDPERSGPSVAIVVNDTPYLVDFGPVAVLRLGNGSRTKNASAWSVGRGRSRVLWHAR